MCRRAAVACAWIVAVAAALVYVGPRTEAAKWDPIDPAELAMTKPVVEADADAEVLLWDVQVSDESFGETQGTVYDHYIRIKLFTDRGRDAHSRIDIPHPGNVRVRDVEGRTTKRDGSSVDLKSSDVFERDIVKTSGVKVKATSFAMPAADTGGILEYRWREIHQDELASSLRLPFSRDIPVRLVRYHIKPLALGGTEFVMRGAPFHCQPAPLNRDQPNRFTTSLTNVPAFHDEPRAPSEWELTPWLFIYYDYRMTPGSPRDFWTDWSKTEFKDSRSAFSPSKRTKEAVASLVTKGMTVSDTISVLLDFCRTNIARMDVDTADDGIRKAFKGNKAPQDALASGKGNASDVRGLFVAMARAAGLDARLAPIPSRDDVTFDPVMKLPYLLDTYVVVIRDGTTWRFVDPTNTYAPAGELRWQHEGHNVLIPDEQGLVTAPSPTRPPEWSTRTRRVAMTLAEDGSVEGDLTGEMTGHVGLAAKEREDNLAPAEREKALVDLFTERLPGIEITQVQIDHVTDPAAPYTYRAHFKMAGYAQRAGSRLFVVPAIFQKGVPPEFSVERRQHPVFFPYAWHEVDTVDITLPPGYKLESTTPPDDLSLSTVTSYNTTITPSADGHTVQFHREFVFGGGGNLRFAASSYPLIRTYFDNVVKRDAVALVLRRSAQ
jgi:transglutaminase-like putative cysteine protease